MRALLLDIGGVVLRSAHEMMGRLGGRRPELREVTDRRGRLGPVADPRWELALCGALAERAYWAERAAEVAELTGVDASSSALMHLLYGGDDDITRPAARTLVADARAAGATVAALTNDLTVFHGGDADVTGHPALAGLDPLVDGAVIGVLKPDPAAYRIALEAVGRRADEVVFLDDMPANVEGARAVGLTTVWVDVTDPDAAFGRARALLGLDRSAA